MWTHLFEALLTGVGLFVVPLVFVAVIAGALALIDQLFHFLRAHHHPG